MSYYGLYHLNQTSGHFDRAEDMEAIDDLDAAAKARELQGTSAVELWHEDRKICRIEGIELH